MCGSGRAEVEGRIAAIAHAVRRPSDDAMPDLYLEYHRSGAAADAPGAEQPVAI